MRARTGKVVKEITTHMKIRNRAKSTSLVPATILQRIRARPMPKTKGRDIPPTVMLITLFASRSSLIFHNLGGSLFALRIEPMEKNKDTIIFCMQRQVE
ncbi:hypothetical protein JHK85_028705 [Glycine max]|nr:hypothetical protein JHK85_028705 [Glycine max]